MDFSDALRTSHLLETLSRAGAEHAIEAVLAHDLVAEVDLGYQYGVACLLAALNTVEATDTAIAIALRTIARDDPPNPYTTRDLLRAFADVPIGALSEVRAYARHAANAGLFAECLYAFPAWHDEFSHGREPDGSASPPWNWQDTRSQ